MKVGTFLVTVVMYDEDVMPSPESVAEAIRTGGCYHATIIEAVQFSPAVPEMEDF